MTRRRRASTHQAKRIGGRVAAILAGLTLIGSLAGCGADSSGSVGGEADAPELLVAAASDLRFAFDEMGAAFERETGVETTFSYGSSGQLAQQIANGAPFDLYASASAAFVDQVIEAGRGEPETKQTYAFGYITVYSPEREHSLADLAGSSVRRVAIANPEHAPYGLAAEQALRSSGLWDAVEPKLVLGENISDAQRIVDSGNAEAGIVALSLALPSDGAYTRISARLHAPLEQALVVTAEGAAAERAAEFAAFVGSPEGRRVMRRYGFLLPGERREGAASAG